MKERAWLWLAATGQLAAFGWCTFSRHLTILGEQFAGALCADRWSAYNWLTRRALCWAHLMRDLGATAERHHSPWHGQRLAMLAGEVLAVWKPWHEGKIDRPVMLLRIQPLRARMEQLLAWTAAHAPGPKARTIARDLLSRQDQMWRFLEDERVQPTNNLAERLLRYAVIWCKLSFGTDSEAGSRYVERLLSTVATLQLQGRDVFACLTDAMTAHAAGLPPPSLLPLPPDP